ncbi:MAG: hypothetical protein ABI792_08070 [bacterium]
MIVSIKEYIELNYPEISIISAQEVTPAIKDPAIETSSLKFYDVTFDYKGKRFSKLFHDRLKETIEQQFTEAVMRAEIKLPD